MEVLGETLSICPVCHKRIHAEKVKRGEKVYLEKFCAKHGFFSVLIWNGTPDYLSWGNKGEYASTVMRNAKPHEKGCPYDCGICEEHITGTCCVLLEVTKRCNLKCPVCYADAGYGTDVSLEDIKALYNMLLKNGKFNIQLSGGEPSLRDDLPDIIKIGRDMGFDFFQLNTNGIRLAEDWEYVLRLKNAGLNCIFLQFDSMRDEAYISIRGKKLKDIKLKAVKNAGKAGLGVVLVPTIVSGVNDCDIGEIIDFAVRNMPVVRGVHFQPISFFGRYNSEFMKPERLTLPDMLRLIETQTGGIMKSAHFTAGNTESAYCSFHGAFIKENGQLKAKKASKKSCCCSSPVKARDYVAGRWSAAPGISIGENTGSLDKFLLQYERDTLAVSCMIFQDAWTLDLDRLKRCYIHVAGERGLVPFCAHNIAIGEI